MLSSHLADWVRRHGLEGSAGIVAVSGGPDSVALAHLLTPLLQQGKLERLILAHVNHQLRGGESDDDEIFVQRLPELWQRADPRLSCKTTRIDVADIAQRERENLESIARRERYRWLEQLALRENAAWIAVGHTRDDQAETVLFRLLRGSGLLGLSAMAEDRPLGPQVRLVRPLLTMRRQAILDYLRDQHLSYRVDSSNRDRRFTRNRLRLELMPTLERDYNAGIVELLCRLADEAQELHAEVAGRALQLLVEAERPRAADVLVFAVDSLHGEPANLVREMFRLVWQRENWPMGEMDFERWHRLVEIVQGACPAWDFPGPIHARRVGPVVQILAKRPKE